MLEGRDSAAPLGLTVSEFSYLPPFAPNYIDHMGQQGENLVGRWTHKSLDALSNHASGLILSC